MDKEIASSRPLTAKGALTKEECHEAFFHLRDLIYEYLDAETDNMQIFRESGRLDPDRPYFYIQRAGENGWIFERSGAGWVISPAQKRAHADLFLRPYDSFDQTTLERPQTDGASMRVRSLLRDGDTLSLPVYAQMIADYFIGDESE